MSHFQKIHSATNECEGIGQEGGSEMAWGCVLEGSESSPGERWGSGNGKPGGCLPHVCSWQEGCYGGLERVCFSAALLRLRHVDLHPAQRCYPQTPLKPSSDVRIILPFHTLSCFSLNCNWFLHNEKPAEE